MHPRPRCTALQDHASGAWYVCGRLRHRLVVSVCDDSGVAIAQAVLWEVYWRDAWARWQRQEQPRRHLLWWGRHWSAVPLGHADTVSTMAVACADLTSFAWPDAA